MKKKVAILGASDNPERYSYKAFKSLTAKGHEVFLVSPHVEQVEGVKVYPKLADIKEPIDTLTMYVGPKLSEVLSPEILDFHPKRVIFNPGAENPALSAKLERQGVEVLDACTLVLLSIDRF